MQQVNRSFSRYPQLCTEVGIDLPAKHDAISLFRHKFQTLTIAYDHFGGCIKTYTVKNIHRKKNTKKT